ncbi:MAG: cell division topological specificity factor MinE [Thermotogae bacterium]|uniref:Cell division topological specificity factor MinE n=1 Tax=Kosmotoga arenicorallina TaxID=688066 RepID=A0A7C5I3A2_9BACT|nr:cell division topological specificity factor MinE [Kosmotoga sp.]MBO8165720.1 cell division topological specificity factor MinE [Kosmotoga sp.]MCD6160580.1 cell division topological specificity factor MinE [Kosmotoga sp.]RKX50813.1 MAG: cell division topological specificity factor MinE [Thermotogota bacterium]HHF08275.1 cell division topological specificity factor MinE [Kosmotoga arenicorallina]
MFFGFFRRKKKDRGSRKEAKDRLQAIVAGRRHSVPVREVIPAEVFKNSEQDVVKQIKSYVAERFMVNEENVRVQFEEHNGYVVIITNVVFH